MKKLFLLFFSLIGVINAQSQIKAPVLREISFNISIKNVNGKENYTRRKDNHVFDAIYEILIKKEDLNYTSANNLIGISTGFKERGKFVKGYKNGFWKTTYKNKLVKSENWNEGLIIGKYRVYNIKGEILYKTTFGIQGNGKFKDYYYKTGVLKLEGNYENGKKEGEWCDYDKQGNLRTTTYYKRGVPLKK